MSPGGDPAGADVEDDVIVVVDAVCVVVVVLLVLLVDDMPPDELVVEEPDALADVALVELEPPEDDVDACALELAPDVDEWLFDPCPFEELLLPASLPVPVSLGDCDPQAAATAAASDRAAAPVQSRRAQTQDKVRR